MHKYILSLALVFLCCAGTAKVETAKSCDIGNYKTVDIDGQVWLAENWNCDSTPSKCYDNDPANCQKYGRLYSWETAKKACPSGWHLPSDEDWNSLMKLIDTAATKLKDTNGFAALLGGSFDWVYVSSNPPKASDNFQDIGNRGYWWSSGTANISTDSYWYISNENNNARYAYTDPRQPPIVGVSRTSWFSVRCVKD